MNTVIGVVQAGDKENDTVIFSITNSTNSEGMSNINMLCLFGM